VTAPAPGAPIAIPPPNDEDDPLLTPRIAFVGDRDCFEFTTVGGTNEMIIGFDQTNGSFTKNEVRLFKDGDLFGSKVNGGDFTFSPDINTPVGANYRIEVNNLIDLLPTYAMTVDIGASCIGATCKLTPSSPVSGTLDVTNTSDTWDILQSADPAVAFANPGVASFFFDESGSGNRKLEILTAAGIVCSGGPQTSDIFIENCDVTRASGEPQAQVTLTSGSGGAYTLSMGPELLSRCITPPPIPLSTLTVGSLEDFGEEDVYSFTLSQAGQVGFGFHDDGIGSSSNNIVKLINAADCDAFMRDPNFLGIQTFTGTSHGGATAIMLPAGPYLLVVDNDKNGTGSYEVCAGPGYDVQDKDQNNQTVIPPFGVLSPTGIAEADELPCGDSDDWYITSTIGQQVVIEARESPTFTGNMSVQVFNGAALVASDDGRDLGKVTVTLSANVTYRVNVDNLTYGSGNYTLSIKPPA